MAGKEEEMPRGSNAMAVDRRRALGYLAGAGVAAAVAPTTSSAEPARAAARGAIVDVHHHYFPPAWMEHARAWFIAVTASANRPQEWTPEHSLEAMSTAGVDTAVLSITSPGFAFAGVPAVPLARNCNEYAARLAQDHGRSFRFFTALPMPDVKAAIAEANHAFDNLGALGVGLMTNYDGRYLGDAAFLPLFDALNDRRAVVHVHPTDTPRCREMNPGISTPVLELPVDTGRTIMSLLWAGVFSRFPRIRFIFSHGGGIAPAIYSRIVEVGNGKPELAARVPEGPETALSRIFVDTAALHHRQSFAVGRSWMTPTNVLHGSDYPWTAPAVTVAAINKFELDATARRRMLADNAKSLFGNIK